MRRASATRAALFASTCRLSRPFRQHTPSQPSPLRPLRRILTQVIVQQGDTPAGLYIVQAGRCTVQREVTLQHAPRPAPIPSWQSPQRPSRRPGAAAGGGRPSGSAGPQSHLALGRSGAPTRAASPPRTRSMHLETLMPRDTYGGDAVLHGAMRSHTSLVAETDVTLLFMSRQDFSPWHLTEEVGRPPPPTAAHRRPPPPIALRRSTCHARGKSSSRARARMLLVRCARFSAAGPDGAVAATCGRHMPCHAVPPHADVAHSCAW